ncbi:MAG: glycoside hydrolase family 3 N-terminal domain-containing protein [Pseudomonadota bacterium]
MAEPPAGAAAAIFGCAGPALSAAERAFFRESVPFGFILFARNVESPEQLSRLTAELREAAGWPAPILIDQEGGRVARLRPPHLRGWPPVGAWTDAADDGALSEAALLEALRLRHRVIAHELAAVGIDVDCAPLLDVRRREAHAIIGDRALGRSAEAVARRARAACAGLRGGGVAPVIKHVPGHGRALVDSHAALPVVDAPLEELDAVDFAPFAALRDEAMAMTAHVVYAALDPERCATLSPRVVEETIRGRIGFDGLLMTDDLSMGALETGALETGALDAGAGAAAAPARFAARAAAALAAGCDVILHCNGAMDEMKGVAAGAGALTPAAARRGAAALAIRAAGDAEGFDPAEAEARLAAALGPVSGGGDG